MQTKMIIEQSLHWVRFLSCNSTIFSSQVSITMKKIQAIQRRKESKYKRGVIKVHVRP